MRDTDKKQSSENQRVSVVYDSFVERNDLQGVDGIEGQGQGTFGNDFYEQTRRQRFACLLLVSCSQPKPTKVIRQRTTTRHNNYSTKLYPVYIRSEKRIHASVLSIRDKCVSVHKHVCMYVCWEGSNYVPVRTYMQLLHMMYIEDFETNRKSARDSGGLRMFSVQANVQCSTKCTMTEHHLHRNSHGTQHRSTWKWGKVNRPHQSMAIELHSRERVESYQKQSQ